MRHPFPLLLFLAAALIGFAATFPPSTSLSGTVRDAQSLKPLAGASLRVFQQEKLVAQALADTAGHFNLTLTHGTYTLECTHSGYVSVRFMRLETLENQDRALSIRLDASTPGLDESVVKNYRTPDEPEPRTSSTKPSTATVAEGRFEGAVYDTIVSFDPETYETRITIVPRGTVVAPETPVDGAAFDTVILFSPETYEERVAIVPRGTAAPTSKDELLISKPASTPASEGRAVISHKMSRGEHKMAAKPSPGKAIDAPPTAFSAPAPASGGESKSSPYRGTAFKAKSATPAAKVIEAKDLADDADKKPAPPPTEPAPTQPRAGLLTAGEWNDLHNWNRHWLDLLNDGEIESHQKTYGFTPRYRYTVMLTNEQDFPLADVAVMLQSGGKTIWEARTDNTGKAELWKSLTSSTAETSAKVGSLNAVAVVEGKVHNLGNPKEAAAGINRHRIAAECKAPNNVDIVWAVDATGSMGDEIEYLKTELLDVIGRAKALNGDLSFRMGTTFYRDEGDEYITKSSGLSYDISKTVDFIRQQHAGGGGDTPEAVHSALEEAVFNQKWSDRAIARICFLVLDASPHHTPEVNASLQRCIREAARRGIRVVPVTASGIQKDTEFLMKFFGLATNGTYVFLTDHSGIGGKHLEPTTDEYKVENLNNLLVRLIGEYTAIETCEGKSAIRFEGDEQQQQQNPTGQALYYPNPASTQFMLELPFEVQSVTLYDAEGKAARKLEKPQAGLNTMSVADLSDGFYTIRILKDGRMQSGKILVVKRL